MYHGARGTHGAWGQVLELKLRGWALGVSYNSSLEKSNERSTYSPPQKILCSKERSKGR